MSGAQTLEHLGKTWELAKPNYITVVQLETLHSFLCPPVRDSCTQPFKSEVPTWHLFGCPTESWSRLLLPGQPHSLKINNNSI